MANNPNAIANLRPKPWKKGQSGNPAGRPARKPIEEVFQEFLNEMVKDKNGISKERLRGVVEAQWVQAVKGNTQAANFVFDRAFGKAKQTVAHEGGLDIQDNRKGVIERLIERNKK